MPTAFVIMPFDPELEPVYTDLIKRVFVDHGFDVQRADDIESQQIILKDIVQLIYSSDLIVADLTDNNANVYYELGIAHAFEKPVILTTQNLDEVPFDLRPYRILVYSTHFSSFNAAVEQLGTYAEAFLEKSLLFGNPVTDFLSGRATHADTGTMDNLGASARRQTLDQEGSPPQSNRSAPLEHADDRGVLDYIEAINEGYSSVALVMLEATASMNEMTDHMGTATVELNRIAQNPTHRSWSQIINVCRGIATRVNDFTRDLGAGNDVFSKVMNDTQDSLERLVSASVATGQRMDPETIRGIDKLETLQSQAMSAKAKLLELALLMDGVPRLERRLNRALDNGSREIRGLTANIEKLIRSVARAIDAAEGNPSD